MLNELNQKNKELSASIKQLRISGTALAEAEMNYKMALHKAVLELKEKGEKTTLIPLMIYGLKEVAEMRFKRDIAEVVYNANQESINATKLQMKILENQIQREWGQNE